MLHTVRHHLLLALGCLLLSGGALAESLPANPLPPTATEAIEQTAQADDQLTFQRLCHGLHQYRLQTADTRR